MPLRLKTLTILLIFTAGIIFPFLKVEKVESASFSVSYDMTFTLSDDGSAKVTQKIVLQNLTADLYPSEYSLNIGASDIKNASGTDSLGSFKVSSKKNKDLTTLSAKLNDKVIGKNKQTRFTLNYTINNISTKNGNMWEVLTPGINTSEKLGSFSLKLKVPKNFGDLYSIYPNPDKTTEDKKFRIFTFNKKSSPAQTIIASFGDFQVAKFVFRKKLKNPNFFSKEEKILLPRDTNFQEVNFTKINPRPEKIEEGVDGNYFALYQLGAGEEKEVLVEGFVKIDKSISNGFTQEVPSEISSNQKYWDTTSKNILDKASELSGAKEIYEFVTSTLVFNNEKSERDANQRFGGSLALTKPDEALSSEFVDLFISLSKAKNIPARQVIGFVIGDGTSLTPTLVNEDKSSDELHTWVEYFDNESKRWVQVDPTWASTRKVNYFNYSDANHFALFIRESSSEEPKIPEMFLTSTDNSSSVTFVKEVFNFQTNPIVEIDISQTISGFPTSGKIIIKNDTGKSLRYSRIDILAESLQLIGEGSREIGTILPFSEYVVNIKLRSGSIFKSGEGKLTTKLVGYDQGVAKTFEQSKVIAISPFFSLNTPQFLLLFILLATLGGLFYPLFRKFKNRLT